MFNDVEFNDLFRLIVSKFRKSYPSEFKDILVDLLATFMVLNKRLPVFNEENLKVVKENSDIFCLRMDVIVELGAELDVISEVFDFFREIGCDYKDMLRVFPSVLVDKGYDKCPINEISRHFNIYSTFRDVLEGKRGLEDFLSLDEIVYKYELLFELITTKKEFVEKVREHIDENWESIYSEFKDKRPKDLFYLFRVLCVIGADDKVKIVKKRLKDIENPLYKANYLSSYIVHLILKNEIDQAFKILEDHEDLRDFIIYLTSKILIELNLHDNVFLLVSKIDDMYNKVLCLNDLARDLVLKNDYKNAMIYLKFMLDVSFKHFWDILDSFYIGRGKFYNFLMSLSPENLIYNGIQLLMDIKEFDKALRYTFVFCKWFEILCEEYTTINSFIKFYQKDYKRAVEIARLPKTLEIDLLEFIKQYLPKEDSIKVLEILLSEDPRKYENYLLAFALEYYGEIANNTESLLEFTQKIIENAKDTEEKTIALLSTIQYAKNKKLLEELKKEAERNPENEIIQERYLVAIVYIDPEKALQEIKNNIDKMKPETIEMILFHIWGRKSSK